MGFGSEDIYKTNPLTLFCVSPDHSFAAGQLVGQEAQDGGLLSGRVSLEGFGLQAQGQRCQLCVDTMSAHVHLQHLGDVVSVDAHVGQMVSQHGFGLNKTGTKCLILILLLN